MASTFKRLVIWRSVFLFFGTKSLVKGSGRVSGRVRLGLGLGLGVGLGASLLLIASCQCTIPRDRVPVHDT